MFVAKHRKGGYYITALKCSLTCVCVYVCDIMGQMRRLGIRTTKSLSLVSWHLALYEYLPTILYCAIYKSEAGGFKITSLKTLYLCR